MCQKLLGSGEMMSRNLAAFMKLLVKWGKDGLLAICLAQVSYLDKEKEGSFVVIASVRVI